MVIIVLGRKAVIGEESKLLPPNENVAVRLFTDVCWSLTCAASGVRGAELGDEVSLRPSAGKGYGVYANVPIPAGSYLCRYTGFLRDAEAHTRACNMGLTSLDYAWALGDWVIDADDSSFSSWARYVNHSRGPKRNVQHVYVSLPEWIQALPLPVPKEPYAVWFEAKRDIAVGEELLVDYGTNYWDSSVLMSLHKAAPLAAPLWRLHPTRIKIDLF